MLFIAVLQILIQVPQLKFAVAREMLLYARMMVALEMMTGVLIIFWLANRNGKYGIGGRMILGLVNILERIVLTIINHDIRSLALPLIIATVVMIIVLVMENAEKRIPVQRVSIHNIYADKNYMAIKLNPVGGNASHVFYGSIYVAASLYFFVRIFIPTAYRDCLVAGKHDVNQTFGNYGLHRMYIFTND